MSDVPEQHKQALLRAIWRTKLHVAPRALELSAPSVRNAFEHVLAPADRMLALVGDLPAGLLQLWLANLHGHAVASHLPTCYEPGRYAWRTGDLQGVAQLCVADLANDPATALKALLRLCDHLMGSAAQGAMFSEGVGVTPVLADAAQRFVRINALGYGHDRLDVASARDYFVATWAIYLSDAMQLNILDPQMFRLFRDRLMNPRFWLSPDA